MNPRLKSILSRSASQPNGCLLFGNPNAAARYWSVKVNGKVVNAHRAVWMLANGPIAVGLCVCHTCDNPRCVNLAHLFLGTAKDNAQDCVSKGRKNPASGARCHFSKLTEAQVSEVRELKQFGFTYWMIARRVNVTVSCIQKICRGNHWKPALLKHQQMTEAA